MAQQDDPQLLSLQYIPLQLSFPMALKAAIELRVFEILAEGGPGAELSPPEMVAKMPTTNPDAAAALDRILRILVAHSILTVKEPKDGEAWNLYGLTVQSRRLIPGSHGPAMAPYVEFSLLKPIVDSLQHLAGAVLEAGPPPFNRVHGKEFFEYAEADPKIGEVFHKAMSNSVTIMLNELFEVYHGFKDVKEVVDVGGGTGTCISLIVEKYPHIRGVNYDLPYVIATAPQYPGVEHIPGDMFESVPTAADAIFIRGILHNWSDEQCLKLLRNCCKALPDHGKVINMEYVIPPVLGTDEVSRFTLCMDIHMMAVTDGGKERKASEYVALAKAAGFAEVKVFPAAHNAIMEFHKSAVSATG